MKYWVIKNDEQFSFQLDNFNNKVPAYQVMFNLTADDLAEVDKDSAYYTWAITATNRFAETKRGWTGFKNNLRYGLPIITNIPMPEAVDVEPIPGVVPAGIQFRFTTLVNRIKAHNNYTKAIGVVLGIEAEGQSRPADATAQPILRAGMNGGRVILYWRKGIYDGIVIEKDNGNGSGFVAFDKDIHPNYTDATAIPLASHSAVWKYRAMYLYKDAKVGVWSDVVTITVGD